MARERKNRTIIYACVRDQIIIYYRIGNMPVRGVVGGRATRAQSDRKTMNFTCPWVSAQRFVDIIHVY